MALICCPVCRRDTEMRDFHHPPYRFGLGEVASVIATECPPWKPAEGFCRNCAESYRLKVEERKLIAERILEALKELPEVEKRVFVFYHYRGIGVPEIAARERLGEQAVRELLTKAAVGLYGKLHAFVPVIRRPGVRPGR